MGTNPVSLCLAPLGGVFASLDTQHEAFALRARLSGHESSLFLPRSARLVVFGTSASLRSRWWERPQTDSTDSPWKYYPQTFARYGRNIMGGSVMAVYDVNGDRLNDAVPVLNAHGWGLAWFEQNKDADGNNRSGTGSDVLPVDLNRTAAWIW